jgi:serine O-acetyltransferase
MGPSSVPSEHRSGAAILETASDPRVDEVEITTTNWVEEDLPHLIDEIVHNYEVYGDIDYLAGKDLPSKQSVIEVLEDLLKVLFPGYPGKEDVKNANIRTFLSKSLQTIYARLVDEVDKSLKYACRKLETCPTDACRRQAQQIGQELLEKIPLIRTLLMGDINAAYEGDPAATSTDEVILSYPCVLAIATYRLAHELYNKGVPFIPRIMSEYAHSKTGIDIHPGAKIGRNFFIDHGTGVVIGETAKIGDNVKIYQGVTLGALSFPRDENGAIIKGKKRHPTVGNNVIIYSGATILGGETLIGDHVIVGGNVWLTSSISPDTKVTIVRPEQRTQEIHVDPHGDSR